MTSEKSHVHDTAEEISRYLAEHPDAADTLDGIQQWWLFRQRLDESLDLVSRAVEDLIRRGVVERRRLADGTILFVRAK